jgi:membrane associated rhomboid family serine protease
MRRPPSPALLPAYPVAGGIGLMAIAVTVATGTGRWPVARFEMAPTAFHGEPWRLLTSALPHLDVFHLAFNVYWLWVFGTLLEEVLGHARLLALIVVLAAGSAAAEYAVTVGGLGLSGVGYGLFGMLWVLSSRDRRFAGAVDARTAQLFGVWFVLCIAATYLKVWAIANVAHGIGAVLGALVALAMSAQGIPRRVAAAAGGVAVLAASFVGAAALRPRVNLSHDGLGSAQLGYQAIQDGRFDDAIRHYRDAIAMDPGDSIAFYNLGIAYEDARRFDEAVTAFRRSLELDPHNHHHRTAYVSAAKQSVARLQVSEDHDQEAAVLRDLLAVTPEDTTAWLQLAQCYHDLGRPEDEEKARRRAMATLTGDDGGARRAP